MEHVILKVKPKLYTMKVDPKILDQWRYFASTNNMPLSRIIKKLMNGQDLPQVVPRKKAPKQTYSNVDPKLLRELNAIGNNINQISTRLNMGQNFDHIFLLRCIEQNLQNLMDKHNAL